MPKVQIHSSATLLGTSGNDTLLVGSSVTSINGGAGIDTAVFSSPLDWYTITSSSTGLKVKNTHTGVTVSLTGIELLDFAGGTVMNAAGATLSQSSGKLTLSAGSGNNTVVLGSEPSTVVLGGANNSLTLGAGLDTVTLGTGNDLLKATAATLNTGDSLNGGAGTNTFALSGGGTVNLAAIAQFVNFQNVVLDATGTTLTLGSAAETVTAAGGNNVVTLGAGVDNLSLGNGNDVVKATAATLNAADHLNGGSGTNTLSLAGGGSVNLASLAQFSNFQTVALDATGTTLTLGNAAEIVTAAGGNNSVTLGSGLETVTLGAGNDTVYANGASLNAGDHIDGGAGSNTLVLSGGGAVQAQFSNFQTVMLDSSGTTLTISNDPVIVAAGGNNVVTLGNFPNTVTLGTGNDVVTLGGGLDTVHMGGGNDVIKLTAGTLNAADTLDGGTGVNTLVVTGGGTVNLPGVAQVTNFQDVALDSSGTTITLTNDPTTLTASGGNNVVTLGNGLDTVTLGAGNDTVMVGAGAANGSTINGGTGQNVAVLANAVTSYTVTPTTAGVDVTNGQTGAVVHLANFSSIDFAGGAVYDVSTGQLSGAAPPSQTYPATVTYSLGSDIGTSGNDSIYVDVSTTPHTFVDGGPGSDTAMFTFGYSNWYQITKNADGSVDLIEVHGTGDTAHLVNVETIQFQDSVQYDVATGQLSAITQAPSTGGGSTTPSSSGSNSSAIVSAPVLPQAQNTGEIVAFQLQNNQSSAVGAHEITFGQAFVAGQVPSGSHLVAIVNGVEIPVQMDVETTNPDGSARMAVLTIDAPAMAANSSTNFMLKLSSTPVTTPNVDISHLATGGAYHVDVNLAVHNADGSTSSYTLDAATVLANALKNGTASYWLNGPQATEVRVDAPVQGSLHVTFDIRSYADGTTYTDVEFNNDLAVSSGGGSVTYDATVTQNGATVVQQSNITQSQYSTWHQEIWSNGAPTENVVHDISYLEKSGALQNYDTSGGLSQSLVGDGFVQSAATILGTAGITQYMGQTGLRPDIGPTTGANASWLLTQSQAAAQAALAQADAAGSIPWHVVDPATGTYVSVENQPNLWLDYRGGVASGTTGLPAATNGNTNTPTNGGWAVDAAHQPDLSYDAYLLTGSRYYLDQLQAQASYDIASDNPSARNNAAGIVTSAGDQVRAEAWNLRDIGEAAYLSPDSSPLKAYFQQVVANNVANLLSEAQSSSEGALSGWQWGVYGSSNGAIAPWQQDYFVSTMGALAEQGVPGAAQFMQWENNFIAGRFLNGANGFDPHNGVVYNLYAWDPTTGAPYTTWAQAEAATTAAGAAEDGNWSQSSLEYQAGARAALADEITVTQSPDAIAAFGWLVANAPGANPANINGNDVAAATIAPRLSDGNLLTAANIHIDDSTAPTTILADNNDQLIYLTSGDHTVTGGSGMNLLFAGSGNDTLIGGANNDYLYGGSGQDKLDGGAGNNYLRSGSGPTTFVFDAVGAAQDTISQFKAGTDILEVHEIAGRSVTAAQLISTATQDSAGDAVLHLDATHSVVLLGIHANQLQTSWFHTV